MKSKYSLPKDGGLIAESTPRDILHRYEKMPTTVFETESEGAQCIADRIVAAINAHRGRSEERRVGKECHWRG